MILVWHKDARYSCTIKDEAGCPSFALVNKATGDALKHSLGYRCPVSFNCCHPHLILLAAVSVLS
uniref:Uncharacterized protein n=1 Tax=Oryza punctata TaxID=4537 RepID=A0A0E0KD67_ORYPU